jgi:hypothetical protein
VPVPATPRAPVDQRIQPPHLPGISTPLRLRYRGLIMRTFIARALIVCDVQPKKKEATILHHHRTSLPTPTPAESALLRQQRVGRRRRSSFVIVPSTSLACPGRASPHEPKTGARRANFLDFSRRVLWGILRPAPLLRTFLPEFRAQQPTERGHRADVRALPSLLASGKLFLSLHRGLLDEPGPRLMATGSRPIGGPRSGHLPTPSQQGQLAVVLSGRTAHPGARYR